MTLTSRRVQAAEQLCRAASCVFEYTVWVRKQSRSAPAGQAAGAIRRGRARTKEQVRHRHQHVEECRQHRPPNCAMRMQPCASRSISAHLSRVHYSLQQRRVMGAHQQLQKDTHGEGKCQRCQPARAAAWCSSGHHTTERLNRVALGIPDAKARAENTKEGATRTLRARTHPSALTTRD